MPGRRKVGGLAAVAVLAAPVLLAGQEESQARGATDWRDAWAVEGGFTLEIDVRGLHMPTALAFVPEPGPNPDDPLYFVTELRGAIKVVTNDRSVHTFAEDFVRFRPVAELPEGEGQAGLAGLCLSPAHGYVFATFAYQDSIGVLRNDVIRFETSPGTFALRPSSSTRFTDSFAAHESGLSHQIGNCQVAGERLFVGVGEGWQPFKARQLAHLNGKLVRMDLDGRPVPDNPYYEASDARSARSYIWASGLRNPFSLRLVGDRLFLAENGVAIDRFLEVERGVDYLWEGSDATIAANADYVFVPSIGPVQIDYQPAGEGALPDRYGPGFLIAASADRPEVNPGIVILPYDVATNRVRGEPEWLVRYREESYQPITGLALASDGLYWTPLFWGESPESVVLRLRADREAEWPHRMVDEPRVLMHENGCTGCHTFNEHLGFGGVEAPPLDNRGELAARVHRRVSNRPYEDSLRAMLERGEGEAEFQEARRAVLETEGIERVRTWITYRILAPRFDNPNILMPDLELSHEEARSIASFLTQRFEGDPAESSTLRGRALDLLRTVLPGRRYERKHIVFAFGLGGIAGGIVMTGLVGGWIWRRRRRSRG